MSKLFQSDIFKILVYVTAVIVTGSYLAPIFYNWGKTAVEEGRFEDKPIPVLKVDLHSELDRASLPRYWNRAIQLSALVYLIPLFMWLRISPKELLQLKKNPHRLKHFAFGFAIAALWMLVVGLVLLRFDVFSVRANPPDLLKVFHQWLLTALVVSFAEEFFFRGCLLGLSLRKTRRLGALLFVSAFFSAVHFLKPPDEYAVTVPYDIAAERVSNGKAIAIPEGAKLVLIQPFDNRKVEYHETDEKSHRVKLRQADRYILGVNGVESTTGFWLLGQIFKQFGDPRFIIAEFTTLFIIGWILGYTRLKTHSLWLAIGLHAGWIFAYESFRTMTQKDIADTLPWIGNDLKSGLVAIAMVTLTGLLTWAWLKASTRRDRLKAKAAA